VVLLPDGPELERSSNLFKDTLEFCKGVSLSHLYEGREPVKQGLQMLFGMDKSTRPPECAREADVHIVINVSASELPDVQRFVDEVWSRLSARPSLPGTCHSLSEVSEADVGFGSRGVQWHVHPFAAHPASIEAWPPK
jgi:hypothetical protein